jgi:hypothetical protein
MQHAALQGFLQDSRRVRQRVHCRVLVLDGLGIAQQYLLGITVEVYKYERERSGSTVYIRTDRRTNLSEGMDREACLSRMRCALAALALSPGGISTVLRRKRVLHSLLGRCAFFLLRSTAFTASINFSGTSAKFAISSSCSFFSWASCMASSSSCEQEHGEHINNLHKLCRMLTAQTRSTDLKMLCACERAGTGPAGGLAAAVLAVPPRVRGDGAPGQSAVVRIVAANVMRVLQVVGVVVARVVVVPPADTPVVRGRRPQEKVEVLHW